MPAFTFNDWRQEVANGDTRLGYDEWRSHKIEEAANNVPVGVVESAMHIIDGLTHEPNNLQEIFDKWGRGCKELYQSLIPYAEECHRLYTARGVKDQNFDCPGIYDYEVSCVFGAWYGETIMKTGFEPEYETAMTFLKQLDQEFWDQLKGV